MDLSTADKTLIRSTLIARMADTTKAKNELMARYLGGILDRDSLDRNLKAYGRETDRLSALIQKFTED